MYTALSNASRRKWCGNRDEWKRETPSLAGKYLQEGQSAEHEVREMLQEMLSRGGDFSHLFACGSALSVVELQGLWEKLCLPAFAIFLASLMIFI